MVGVDGQQVAWTDVHLWTVGRGDLGGLLGGIFYEGNKSKILTQGALPLSNSLPPFIRHAPSISIFKSYLKTYFFYPGL